MGSVLRPNIFNRLSPTLLDRVNPTLSSSSIITPGVALLYKMRHNHPLLYNFTLWAWCQLVQVVNLWILACHFGVCRWWWRIWSKDEQGFDFPRKKSTVENKWEISPRQERDQAVEQGPWERDCRELETWKRDCKKSLRSLSCIFCVKKALNSMLVKKETSDVAIVFIFGILF